MGCSTGPQFPSLCTPTEQKFSTASAVVIQDQSRHICCELYKENKHRYHSHWFLSLICTPLFLLVMFISGSWALQLKTLFRFTTRCATKMTPNWISMNLILWVFWASSDIFMQTKGDLLVNLEQKWKKKFGKVHCSFFFYVKRTELNEKSPHDNVQIKLLIGTRPNEILGGI